MARIEYREMPHRNAFLVRVHFDATNGVIPAAGNFLVPWIATKRTWVHQCTVYVNVDGGANADLQLEAWAPGETQAGSGGSTTLSDVVGVDTITDGNILTSDMGLAQLINDAQTANFANTTDVFNMDGQSGVETPFQIAPGGGLNILMSGTMTGFVGVVEILLGEDPI